MVWARAAVVQPVLDAVRRVQWLARLPDMCQGVDVRQLREDAERVRAALQALDPAQIASFDRALLRPVQVSEPAE